MNKNYFHIFIIIAALFLSACVPESSGGGKNKSTDAGLSTTPPAANDPDFSEEQDLYWHNFNESTNKVITINENINTVEFLRGETINTFLKSSLDGVTPNTSLSYCLVVSYNTASVKKNLRVRAAPDTKMNLATGETENVLRIDFTQKDASLSLCDGSALQILTTPDAASAVTDADSAFAVVDLCPTCSGLLSSTDVSLYVANDPLTVGDRLTSAALNLSGLGLRVDSLSTTPINNPSCDQTSCNAKGFDCCLNGQCVNDAEVRPNANLQSEYTIALNDVATNPEHFINWPNIYFICGENPTPTPTTPDPTNPEDDAEEILNALIVKYNCLEEGKKEFPNFAGNNVCGPDFNQASYESIRSDVWRECGCNATPFPTEPEDPRCANYGLVANYNATGTEIISVSCTIIKDESNTPFVNTTVSVHTRSVPHRFYRDDNGESVSDFLSLSTTVKPEGESFQYQDLNAKALPACGDTNTTCSNNMNSLLGQMNVDLSAARPALTVELDYDQSYIIYSSSGNYTPCLQCEKDSWFEEFSSHPRVTGTAGLNGQSYTTNRSAYNSNQSRGNYDDTIFGRACFLPPTMIPYSHKKEASVITQRRNRLDTQAALYINGYQKDWFGFNLGALIGSFDGVSWFAIGSNTRRIISKSNKLYLAINAPYADLAAQSAFTVNITLDEGNSLSPSYDYDPNFAFNDSSNQNNGASCQRWHQCNTDTDCITQLGWEYQCQDTGLLRTAWPRFDSDSNEKAFDEYSNANFSRLLTAGMPAGSKKRCVYRGAGALCKVNFTAGLDTNKQKMMACAPNFHCANLDSSTFNTEVNRNITNFSNIRYGKEADIIGRPKHYANALGVLPAQIKTNIRYSGAFHTAQTSDLGICRPGRRTSEVTLIGQHSNSDTLKRTDYINQIGACNSSATGLNRTLSCPIIQKVTDANTDAGNIVLGIDASMQSAQNSCGNETQYLDGMTPKNTFEIIEKDPIGLVSFLVTESLAIDSCKRRPGQVCHSDLDCSPNRLYADLATKLSVSRFGNTKAEKDYWTESLICGQADPTPRPGEPNYNDYDMTKNRCCREIGNDFTMYTEGDLESAADNPGLSVATYPFNNPTANGRYSRYASAGAIDGNPAPVNVTTPYAQSPIIDQTNGVLPKAFQWKTFNDTGKNTCCGGGWVRKFDDDTTDWGRSSRLNIPIENLSCLNYRTNNYKNPIDGVSQNNWDTSRVSFCLSPADGGCIEQGFTETSGLGKIFPPVLLSGMTTATLDTKPFNTPASGGPPGMAGLSINVPYEPLVFANSTPINTADDKFFTYFRNRNTYAGASFYLPAYISHNGVISNIVGSVTFVYYDSDGSTLGTSTPAETLVCAIPTNPTTNLPNNNYCIQDVGGNLVFHAHADTGFAGGSWDYGSIQIEFNVQNGASYVYTGGSTDSSQIGMTAGNEEYYLTKLAKFELLGVPQITYEPIFCNSNRSQLVDGLFDLIAPTRDEFYNNSHVVDAANFAVNGRSLASMYNEDFTTPDINLSSAYDTDGNGVADIIDPTHLWDSTPGAPHVYNEAQERFVFDDKVRLTNIFSSNEFRCCSMLGQAATEDRKCCSGNRDDEGICKLPSKANLNVYFNKFISSEGMGEDLPSGGLTDEDFIPETGEPKITTTVVNKIKAIGELYCESGAIRSGGSFGYYSPQPNSGVFASRETATPEENRRYSIIDDIADNDNDNFSGFSDFAKGYRWDHHIYCE